MKELHYGTAANRNVTQKNLNLNKLSTTQEELSARIAEVWNYYFLE